MLAVAYLLVELVILAVFDVVGAIEVLKIDEIAVLRTNEILVKRENEGEVIRDALGAPHSLGV